MASFSSFSTSSIDSRAGGNCNIEEELHESGGSRNGVVYIWRDEGVAGLNFLGLQFRVVGEDFLRR